MKHDLYGIRIDDLDDAVLDQQLKTWLNGQGSHVIVTPNPEFVLLARRNENFKRLLNKSDLSIADGVGLRFAIAALTNNRLQNRHTGVDLVDRLMNIANETGNHVLLFGGDTYSAEKTKKRMLKLYPMLNIEAIDPGHVVGNVDHSEIEEPLIEQVQSTHPEILIAALGQGKQEQFIDKIRSELPTLKIAIGIGGALDTLSGNKPRAPIIVRKIGLEWVWRMCIEPVRAKRIANAVFVFPIMVICDTLKQHRFLKACRNVIPEIARQLIGK